MSRKSSSVSFGAKPSEPRVCEKPIDLISVLATVWTSRSRLMVTYDRAASLATISDSDIEFCLGFDRLVVLSCLGLLLACDGDGVGSYLRGLLSNLGIDISS